MARQSLTGAPGAKREPDRAKPQLIVSLAKRCAGLTTITASRYRARASRPAAQPPLLCEVCEEGNIAQP